MSSAGDHMVFETHNAAVVYLMRCNQTGSGHLLSCLRETQGPEHLKASEVPVGHSIGLFSKLFSVLDRPRVMQEYAKTSSEKF